MEFFLVGGAVRDQLLGLPVKDRDWVVTGADIEEMLAKSFTQVGADFPVFLHPESKEEYALARTEEKTGVGYHGFDSRFGPEVTLEEDLSRRDLTINAMAMTEAGELVDPYNGQKDLESKTLRHVTEAFSEDPLRVLRVARFMARFKHLGFSVADETKALMTNLVESGELAFLTPERVWKELSRALLDTSPEAFIETLRDVGALKVLLPEIDVLFGVPQPEAHHPEIDTGEHILLCLVQAAKLSDELAVRFATLVHDLGKGLTPPEEWPRHLQHEERGVQPVNEVCDRLKVPNAIRKLAVNVSAYHLKAHRAMELKPGSLMRLIEATDALRNPLGYEQFILACEADARGRLGLENRDYPQAQRLRNALAAAKSVDAKELVDAGYKGEKLGVLLRQKRMNAIKASL